MNEGSLFLLDEPGSYLHTNSQYELLKNLKDTYVMNHAPDIVKAYGVGVMSVAQAINIESRKEHV